MPVYIGFDEEEKQKEIKRLTEEEKEVILEQSKVKEVKLKPERVKEFLKDYDCVVVNEFGDDYHKSEEEREAKNRFYKAFKEFSRHKKIIRKADKYVDAVRSYLKCLDLIANENGIYDPEDFKMKALKGKIEVSGLNFPVFKGKEKRDYSSEYLSEFIVSDKPSSDLLTDPSTYSDEMTEDDISRLFTEEEIENLFKEDESSKFRHQLFDEDYDDIDKYNIVLTLDKKHTKKFIKSCPEFIATYKDMLKSNRERNMLNGFYGTHDMYNEDFDKLKEYDESYNFKSDSDMPEFHGDITDNDAYNKYINKLHEWDLTHVKVSYNGKMKTEEEIKAVDLTTKLEQHGWNIRQLAEYNEKEEKYKKALKSDKKKEKELKAKLYKIQQRVDKDRTLGDDFDTEEKHKKNKKEKTKSKKKNKGHKELKKDAKDSLNRMILSDAGRKEKSFKEYEKNVTDLRGLFDD